MARDLLLEIGVEELPAGFVVGALDQLPSLVEAKLAGLRLGHGAVWAGGTPRRLAVKVADVEERQPDLDEEVVGPPARVAFKDGKPTRAATSFAEKLGIDVSALSTVETPKGEYLAGRRQEPGRQAVEILPAALETLCSELQFKKSMRWGAGKVAFGRPVRWILALLGETALSMKFAGIESDTHTFGHRFRSQGPLTVSRPGDYESTLSEHHVTVDLEARAERMNSRLAAAAKQAGGDLVEDEFLIHENCSLVEDPAVVIGSFEERFLELPEQVILNVAKDHQRYFGIRSADGKLMPRYLAVVNTAQQSENVIKGNDRVMRARLADAKFFYDEDLAKPMAERRAALDRVVFQKRLGSVGDKVRRLVALVGELGELLGLPEAVRATARNGAEYCKCDLVTLMVGEFPELQGEVGAAYLRAQGGTEAVARAVVEHYLPRGADDGIATSDAGALVAIADRLDTLVGCFSVGLVPTGAADPLALRRAAIGLLRTLSGHGWSCSLRAAIERSHAQFSDVDLDADAAAVAGKLGSFFRDRLRGLLLDGLPTDVVEATLASGHDDPYDARLRAEALASIDAELRASAGEVFKRAANIAKKPPEGELQPADQVQPAADVPQAETRLFSVFEALKLELEQAGSDYERAIGAIGRFAPALGAFFDDVLVMHDDDAIRENRLKLMRDVHATCSGLANFNLLAKK